MKKLLKNKRGMAIESAIMFMFIVFMFGLLLSGIVMTTHLRVKVNDTLLDRELEIEQIGEDFVHMDEDNFTVDDKYEAITSYNGNNKTLTLNRNKNTVLFVKVEDGKITSWKYSNNEDNKNG
jgi:hypothetical protein